MKATKIQSTSILLDQNHSPLEELDWKRNIWRNPPIVPKIKIFLWKTAHNALPSGDDLQRKGPTIDTTCRRCGSPGTIPHILFKCPFSQDTWNYSPWVQPFMPWSSNKHSKLLINGWSFPLLVLSQTPSRGSAGCSGPLGIFLFSKT